MEAVSAAGCISAELIWLSWLVGEAQAGRTARSYELVTVDLDSLEGSCRADTNTVLPALPVMTTAMATPTTSMKEKKWKMTEAKTREESVLLAEEEEDNTDGVEEEEEVEKEEEAVFFGRRCGDGLAL